MGTVSGVCRKLTIAVIFLSFLCNTCSSRSLDRGHVERPQSGDELNAKPCGISPFGIGFELSAFYATAAISFANGTNTFLARVDAPKAYAETIRALSQESSKHPSPPYDSIDEQLRDTPRQKLREIRKAIGLPASGDVGALGALLNDARSAAEDKLGCKITEAVASTPNFVALYDEDVRDAFEYIGIDFLPLPSWDHKLLSTGAAYAGYGLGLCKDYLDQKGCWKEKMAMPWEDVMAVTFTKHMLHVTLSVFKSIFYLWEPQYRTHLDWQLGLGELDKKDVKAEAYWAQVVEALGWVMADRPNYAKPQRVILQGESANDERFLAALDEALHSVVDEMPVIYHVEADFVAAKGAAELAKRSPYDWRNRTSQIEVYIGNEQVFEGWKEGKDAGKQVPVELDFEL